MSIALIKFSLIALLFFSGNHGLSQTYVRSMDIGYPIEVTIIFQESDTLNSPLIEIHFLDDFRFQAIEPKCKGDYKWCIYFEDQLIASMRFEFNTGGYDLLVSNKYYETIGETTDPALLEEYLSKVFGHYTLVAD